MALLCQIMMFDPGDRVDALAEERLDSAVSHPEHLDNFLDGLSKGGPIRKWFAAEDLLGITTPTLLFHGRDDRVVPYEHSLLLLAHIPNSRLVLFNRCGHWAMIEHPAEFNRMVTDFIQQQLTPTTRRRTTPMHEAIAHIHKNADLLREEAPKSDELGGSRTRPSGSSRSPAASGFCRPRSPAATRRTPPSSTSGSALWRSTRRRRAGSPVSSASTRGRSRSWTRACRRRSTAPDPDTWTASPYAPVGRAKTVDGGFLFTTDVPYSTGTDFCEWAILGGIVTDDDGNVGTPPDIRHFVLPARRLRDRRGLLERAWASRAPARRTCG